MRQPESPRIDDPICPSISESLEVSSHVCDATTSIEPEEERHVLDQDPRWPTVGDQPEDTPNQPGASSKDPTSLAGLRKVLAGKSGGQQVDTARQLSNGADVWLDSNSREAMLEDSLCARIDLAQ
jgi:hypothetical protein